MVTAVVFLGGPVATGSDPPASERRARDALDDLEVDLVVAADSGLAVARRWGRRADLVVGDMDSVDPFALAAGEEDGARVQRWPADKDATDLELAMDAALVEGAERVVVVGSPDGRMDHLLGGALVLASPRFAAAQVEAWLGGAHLVAIHSRATLHGAPGRYVSILAAHGPATGVHTTGLRWPLRAERLEPGSSRGISNEFSATTAEVSLDTGTLVAIIPDPTEQP